MPRAFREMAEVAAHMLHGSIDSFVHGDVPRWRGGSSRRTSPSTVSTGRSSRDSCSACTKTLRRSTRALELISVSKNLERIADHATNIAEDVVYLVEGEIVRHQATQAG